LKIIF